MKKTLFAVILLLCMGIVGCQKEIPTELNISPSEISFYDNGGTQAISILANKTWMASSSASWCAVSELKGEASQKSLSISCDPNLDYEERTCTITINCEELTKTVNVKQSASEGILVSPTIFEISKEAQTIEVEVKSNVEYSFLIDNACKDWITQVSSKALASNKISFQISENETYDFREGKITFNQTNGALVSVVTVKQRQTDGLFVEQNAYEISSNAQAVEIKVRSNIDFTVSIEDNSKAWISVVSTKSLNESVVILSVSENESFDERIGSVTIKDSASELFDNIEIIQQGLSKEPVVVTLSHAGELSAILGDRKDSIISLSIIGDINSDDVYCFRNMPRLRSISLKDANIVEGGKPFITYGESFMGKNYSGLWATEDRYTVKDDASHIFMGLEKIEEIILPSSLKFLGNSTFFDCRELREITIPKDVSKIIQFNNYTFGCCYNLTNIFVEEGNNTFVSIDGCLYSKDKYYLLAIPCGRNSYTIPNFISEYGIFGECFQHDNELKELVFLDYSPKLDKGFDRLRNIETFIVSNSNQNHTVRDGALYSKDGAILLCYPKGRNDKSYIVPIETTTIGRESFSDNRTLETIILQEGISTIGASAFSYCTRLIDIEMPSTTALIEGNAFQDCRSLSRIICHATIPPKVEGVYVFFDCDNLSEILVPEESLELYKDAPIWQDYSNIIKPLDKSLEYGEKITINVSSYGNLHDILNNYKIDDITNLDLSGYLNSSDFAAIKTLKNIKYLDFSKAVCYNNTIPADAFRDMNRIEYIIYSDSIQKIGNSAFSGCASLEGSIHIPKDIISIGEGAFRYCHNLSGELVFPETLTTIGSSAFYGCSGLKGDLILPDNIAVIELATFADCTGFNGKIILPKYLKRIEGKLGYASAFERCYNITGALEIPDGIEYLGDSSLSGLTNISSVFCSSIHPPQAGTRMFGNHSSSNILIYVPKESLEEYKTANGWSEYADKIHPIEN